MKTIFTAAAVVAAMATSAWAGSIDFTNGLVHPDGKNPVTVDVQNGNVEMTVVAKTWDRESSGNPFNVSIAGDAKLTANGHGLGVRSCGILCLPELDGRVDGIGDDDVLLFSFDKAVKLQSITFESIIDINDKETFVFVQPDNHPNAERLQMTLNGHSGIYTFEHGINISSFGIGAEKKFEGFRVSGLHVTAVPLPASALLLLGGMGGLAAMRRMKKK